MRIQSKNLIYNYINLVCLITLLAGILYSQDVNLYDPVNSENIKQHTDQLGGDIFQGRGTGTKGEYDASAYISDYISSFGVIPLGDRDTYYQNIPMHGSYPLESSNFIISLKDTIKNLELGKEYLLYKTGAATYIPNPIPLVFVSYGIIAPEYDYNDYQNVDVDGKVVVFLSGEPYSDDDNFFRGSKSTVYSYPESKQRIAISRGARGSIMIPLPDSEDEFNWQHWVQEFAFEHVTLAYTVSSHMSALLNPEVSNELFLGSQYSFSDILNMQRNNTLTSFELQTKISFDGQFEERDFIGRNIVGMIEGNDDFLKDSFILLSAHYDHLGIGPPVKGDSVYNGVLDNALGVSSLMEICRILSTSEVNTKRSIIFLWLTGEEKGLLGSTYYTDNPVRPLHKTVAAINIDGIAAFDEFEEIIGVGSELSSLEKDLIEVSSVFSLKVASIPEQYFYESESISKSDQLSFMKAGIPSILITEGVKYKNTSYKQGINRLIQWSENIYHSPFDDLSQKINYEAASQHTKFILDFTLYLGNKIDQPSWNPGSPYINARLQSIAEKR
jgi:hypothetical protein